MLYLIEIIFLVFLMLPDETHKHGRNLRFLVLANDVLWLVSPIDIADRNANLIFQLPLTLTALWPSTE